MAQRIQLRRGTAAEWAAANPVLALGEPGVETDTGKQKFGNGTAVWTALPYASKGDQGIPGVADDASVKDLITTPGSQTATALSATYASYANLAKMPDSITTGAVTVDANNLVTSAAVVWPDGKLGTLTITSRDANNAVLAYNITYGSPVIKTFTQPAITRNAAGAATNVPQIVVS
jgi:hypothetical protein